MSLTKGESLPLARTLLRAAPSGGDTPQRPGWRCVSLAAFTLAQAKCNTNSAETA